MTTPAASPAKQFQAQCPECRGLRFADVLGIKTIRRDAGEWVESAYRMLSCAGCKKIYLHELEINSHDYEHVNGTVFHDEYITTWPKCESRQKPDWLSELALIDGVIARVFEETYRAVNSESPVLAAIGTRTIFDRASELLNVDPGKSFGKKLADLNTSGKIGDAEKKLLEVLTEAGGAAAHRGWSPKEAELWTLLDIVESFVYRALVLEGRVNKMHFAIPKRGAALPPESAASAGVDEFPF